MGSNVVGLKGGHDICGCFGVGGGAGDMGPFSERIKMVGD